MMPPPGTPVEERLIARFRGHARRLFWSALLLIAVCGAVTYLYGNLPAPFEDWMLLGAGAVLIAVGVLLPFVVWASRTYTITTRRVIVRDGIGSRRRREFAHTRGYSITVQRGLLQRLWGAGTITLTNGVDAPLRLVNVPHVNLVNEALADQIEVNQILAHRDAQAIGDRLQAPAPE